MSLTSPLAIELLEETDVDMRRLPFSCATHLTISSKGIQDKSIVSRPGSMSCLRGLTPAVNFSVAISTSAMTSPKAVAERIPYP